MIKYSVETQEGPKPRKDPRKLRKGKKKKQKQKKVISIV